MLTLARKLWQGRVRLWVTYWVFGVGGNMSFVALLAASYALAGPDARAQLWTLYLLSLAWFIWIFGGIWRSARRYPGPAVWAGLARLGVCVGIVRMTGEAIALGLITTRPTP